MIGNVAVLIKVRTLIPFGSEIPLLEMYPHGCTQIHKVICTRITSVINSAIKKKVSIAISTNIKAHSGDSNIRCEKKSLLHPRMYFIIPFV